MQPSENDADIERQKYTEVWADAPPQGSSHGLALWKNYPEIFPPNIKSAIDFGCGRGRLVNEWVEGGIDAIGVDIAPNSIDEDIAENLEERIFVMPIWDFPTPETPFDLAVCTDVLEHIHEHRVQEVIKTIVASAKCSIFKVANFGSNVLGYNLHPTQHPVEWWLNQFQKCGVKTVRVLNLPVNRPEFYIRADQ